MKSIKKNYWFRYTICALLALIILYGWVFPGQISFSNNGDNYRQHYVALMEIGKWYRSIFRTIIFEHRIEIPFYDYSLQYGAGILETYSYYGMYDPLNILSAFVPTQYTEYLFWFLMALRTYLMGISFSLFCRYKKISDGNTLVGAIMYLTCGFNIGPCMSQIIFQPALVMLPALFLGADFILQKKGKKCVYVLSTLIFISCSFYFYYMAAVALVFYCIVWCIVNKKTLKEIGALLMEFVFTTIISIGVGAVYLIPELLTILGNNRMGVSFEIPLLYETKYYIDLFGRLFNTGSIYSEYLGFSAVSVVLMLLLIVKKNKKQDEKILFILGIGGGVSLLVPYIAHVLNGMSYVGNRWTYLLAFYVVFSSVVILNKLDELEISDVKKVIYIWMLISFFVVVLFAECRGLATYLGIAIGGLYLVALILYLVQDQTFNRVLLKRLAIILIFVGTFNNMAPMYKNYNKRMKLGEAYYNAVENTVAQLVNNQTDTYSRIDYSNGALVTYNQSLNANKNGIEYNWSTSSGKVQEFFSKLGVSTYYGQITRGVDGRAYLDNYLGVSEFVVKEGEENQKPYNFTEKIQDFEYDGKRYDVYMSPGVRTGLVRFYTKSMDNKTFEELNFIQRQEALLSFVISDDLLRDSFNDNTYMFNSNPVHFEAISDDNIQVDKDKYIVKKNGSYLNLKLTDTFKDSEVYVILKGIEFSQSNPYGFGGNTFAERWDNLCNYVKWIPDDIAEIQCGYEGVWKSIKYPTPRNQYGYGRDSFACKLGYFESGGNLIQLYFPIAGEYTISEIAIVAQDISDLAEKTNLMYEEGYENVICSSNEIFFETDNDKQGVLQIALPYNRGWKAFVDGEEQKVIPDILFMNIPIESGKHKVVMSYCPYGVKIGLLLSVVSLSVLVIYGFLRKKYVHRIIMQ